MLPHSWAAGSTPLHQSQGHWPLPWHKTQLLWPSTLLPAQATGVSFVQTDSPLPYIWVSPSTHTHPYCQGQHRARESLWVPNRTPKLTQTGTLANFSSFGCSTKSVHLEGLSDKEKPNRTLQENIGRPKGATYSAENVKRFEDIIMEPTKTKGDTIQLQLLGKTYQTGEFSLEKKTTT